MYAFLQVWPGWVAATAPWPAQVLTDITGSSQCDGKIPTSPSNAQWSISGTIASSGVVCRDVKICCANAGIEPIGSNMAAEVDGDQS